MIRLIVFVLLFLLAWLTHTMPRGGLPLIGGAAILMWITDWLIGVGSAVATRKP